MSYPQFQTPITIDTTSAGAFNVGDVLSVSSGVWTGNPTAFTYQWQSVSGGVTANIVGATSSTYTPKSGDVGSLLQVVVTAANSHGVSTVTTAPVGPVAFLPLADPTFVVNSQPSGGDASSSTPNYTAQFDSCDAAVNSSGQFIASAQYAENNRGLRGYTSAGVPVGLKNSRLSQDIDSANTILGCALDTTNIYHTGAGCVARIPIASTNFFSLTGTTTDWANPQYATVSSSAARFIGIAVLGSWIYLVDPNGALLTNNCSPSTTRILPVSTTWTGSSSPYTASTGTPWSVPYCRQIAFDKEGMLWALQEASIANSRAAVLSRWNPSTGAELQSFTLPTSVYPMDIACDPSSDTVLIADNGQDQNFKKYSYDPANVNPMAATTGGPISGSSTIGIQNGYLDSTQGTPGTLGPLRFVNPRAIAVDASGNVLLVQNGLPGAGDKSWALSPCAIESLLNPSGVEQWRNWGGCFGGNGEPSDDGTMFYERQLSFKRSNGDVNGAKIYRGADGAASWLGTNSQYLPYAYTADPFTYAGIEDRAADNSGTPTGVAAGGGTGVLVRTGSNGSTYLFQNGGLNDQFTGVLRVYQVPPGGAIAIPRTVITTSKVYRNGSQAGTLSLSTVTEGGFFVQANMDIWVASGTGGCYRLRLVGFDGAGTPLYDSSHVDAFSAPSEVSSYVMGVRAYGASGGGTVYVGGFGPGQTYPPQAGDNEVRYMTIARYDGVAASGTSWPAATWSYVIPQTLSTGIGHHPYGFCVSPADNRIIIGWQQGSPAPGETGAELEFLVDSSNSSGPTHSSWWQLPGPSTWAWTGVFDILSCVQAKNGYVWCEDDFQSKIVGKACAGT